MAFINSSLQRTICWQKSQEYTHRSIRNDRSLGNGWIFGAGFRLERTRESINGPFAAALYFSVIWLNP